MTYSQEYKTIIKSIFNVQQAVPALEKSATGSTGGRNYGYTPLDKVWEKVQAALKTEGLVVISSPTTGNNFVGKLFQTTIFHIESGEWISDTMDMTTAKDDPQGIGSAITYFRRYMIVSMLGLITRDDNDASEHKLATANQKAKIIGAVKQIFPDVTSQADIISTIQNILGKHPSYIREDEAEDALALIKAFTAKAIKEDE